MGGREEGEGRVGYAGREGMNVRGCGLFAGGGCGGGGGGLESSCSRALAEALWLMGGRRVNSNAAKLYLIFIHMNAVG